MTTTTSPLGRLPGGRYPARMKKSTADIEVTTQTVDGLDGPTFLFRLLNEIGIISQLSTAVLEKTLPDGLKAADFRLLNHFVRLGGPRTPVELARSFQITKGTMTHTLQKMTKLGLVEIAPHGGDGRSKWVDITEAGRRAHAQSLGQLLPEIENILEMLDPAVEAELKNALPALVALRELLDRARD